MLSPETALLVAFLPCQSIVFLCVVMLMKSHMEDCGGNIPIAYLGFRPFVVACCFPHFRPFFQLTML